MPRIGPGGRQWRVGDGQEESAVQRDGESDETVGWSRESASGRAEGAHPCSLVVRGMVAHPQATQTSAERP